MNKKNTTSMFIFVCLFSPRGWSWVEKEEKKPESSKKAAKYIHDKEGGDIVNGGEIKTTTVLFTGLGEGSSRSH